MGVFLYLTHLSSEGESFFFLFASFHMENYDETMCCGNGYKLCYWKSFTEIFHLRASVTLKFFFFFALLHKLCEALCRHPCCPSLKMPGPVQIPSPSQLCAAWSNSLLHLECKYGLHSQPTSNTWPSDSWVFFPCPSPSLLLSVVLYFCVSCSWPCSTFFTLHFSVFFLYSCHLCCPSFLYCTFLVLIFLPSFFMGIFHIFFH